MDQGDHNPPWWTRSGFYILLMNALLDHLFPPKDPLPSRGHLNKNPSPTPLTKEEIKLALSKSSPSSAPGPDGIPYSVWKRVNLIHPNDLT